MKKENSLPSQNDEFKKFKEEFGERIRILRESKGWSQTRLAEELGLSNESRQTISKWETGATSPSLENIINMCEKLECDVGHLFGEYDCKKRQAEDVQELTGLSEKAIEKLFRLRERTSDEKHPGYTNFYINSIIEHDAFLELLLAIKKHVWSFNQKHYGIDKAKPEIQEALANTFNCEPSELEGYIRMSSQSLITSILMKIVSDIT